MLHDHVSNGSLHCLKGASLYSESLDISALDDIISPANSYQYNEIIFTYRGYKYVTSIFPKDNWFVLSEFSNLMIAECTSCNAFSLVTRNLDLFLLFCSFNLKIKNIKRIVIADMHLKKVHCLKFRLNNFCKNFKKTQH